MGAAATLTARRSESAAISLLGSKGEPTCRPPDDESSASSASSRTGAARFDLSGVTFSDDCQSSDDIMLCGNKVGCLVLGC
jgi:hypothetical protein